MNAAGITWPCQSICVTCLSQDRKLFPVNDSKSHASFLFNLSGGDELCWECHFFVRKVAAFQSRAARAQALLASALLQADVTKINSLSSLKVTPVYLDLEIPCLSQVNVKTEIIKEECDTVSCDESWQEMGDDDESLLPVLNKQTEAKGDEGPCGEAMGDDIANASLKSLLNRKSTLINIPSANQYKEDITTEKVDDEVLRKKETAKGPENMMNQFAEVTGNNHLYDEDESSEGMGDEDEIWTPVLNNQPEAKGDEGVCGEVMNDDISNASLKSLLSRKSMISSITPLAKKCKTNDTSTEIDDIKEVLKQKVAKEAEVNQTAPTDPDSNYTVTIMNVEEMLEWRERKKNMPEYATKAIALRCEKCIEPFKNLKVLKAHLRRHEEDYGELACIICGLRSVNESALGQHTALHYRLLKCKLCAHEWDSPNAMRQHCSVAHGIPVTVWDCDQCDRKYSTYIQLTNHVVYHRVMTCQKCGERVSQVMFRQHMRLHDAVKRKCTVCGKECLGDDKLASHMKSHETKVDEAAYCAECNAQFRTMQQYRFHLRYTLKHARSDDMPFKCAECDKSYLTRAQLTIHMDSTHSAERKHACAVCGQTFKTRTRMRFHVRTIHNQVDRRRLICDHCGKKFTSKSILQCHINTHTGARPFACTLCDATFGHKSALYLHGRYKHKIKKKTDAK